MKASARLMRSVRMRWLSILCVASISCAAHADAPAPLGRCQGAVTWLPGDALPDGTPAATRSLATWLASYGQAGDAPLLDPEAIAFLNQRNVEVIGAYRDPLADVAPSLEGVDAELIERMTHISAKLDLGEYVLGPAPDDRFPAPSAFADARHRVENALPVDAVQAVIEPIDLRCIPLAGGLFRGRIDRAFDRNQCSRLHPGDMVRVLRRTADGWLYVRAGHGVGWLEDALLSPPITPVAARDLRNRPRLTVIGDLVPALGARGELTFLRLGASMPLVDDLGDHYQVLVPSPTGWTDAFVAKSAITRGQPTAPSAEVIEGFLPLTRNNMFALAFSRLGDPYGWGGLGGFRDCSALLLDVAATFDLRLGRNSSVQAQAGADVVDISGMDDAAKLTALHDANARGVVLVYMPGHIMLYLGVYEGRDYALSAISEYLLPCPEGGHRTVRIDRVDVTDLERGRGTERTAFLQRITTLAVFGP